MIIYTILGEQSVLCEQKITELLKKHHIEPFDVTTYDMKEHSIQQALFDVRSAPFLSAKKAVIVRHPFFLTGSTQKSEAVHDLAAFEAYLKQPTSENVLIIYAPYEKLDERKKIVKQLKKVSDVITFEAFNTNSLAHWLQQQLVQLSITYDQDAITLLLALTHEKLDLLHRELEKFELYFLETNIRHLDVSVVTVLVSRQLEDNVFELSDAIAKHHVTKAFQIYKDLVQQNEEPIKILILLANQFRLMQQLLKLSKRGYSDAEAAKTLAIHPYRAKLLLQSSYRFSESQLERYLQQLATIDYQIKSGQLHKELALELFILGL